MARDPLPSFVGDSIHGQTKAMLMKMHQERLEKTIQSSLTIIDNESAAASQQQQRTHNKKKKKYYPWVQRDSQKQREKIGQEDRFVHHPFAVLYKVDLAFPGYDRDAPSFHWEYDAMIESLIRNNPPPSRRSKPESELLAEENRPSTPSSPLVGHHLLTRAQRKDIKKVHVPQGIVMQYEGELVSFLDQLTVSDDDDDDDGDDESEEENADDSGNSSEESSDGFEITALSKSMMANSAASEPSDNAVESEDTSNWVLVPSPAEEEEQQEESEAKPLAFTEVPTISSQAATTSIIDQSKQEPQPSSISTRSTVPSAPQVDGEDRCQIYLRWDIQDQFLRFVAHALCAFYGLVSFSKTALDGKRWVYICHPTHLDSIGHLTAAGEPPTASKSAPASAPSSRPLSGKLQKTLDHVQELAVHELEQLWNKVEPSKVSNCPRPDMTFFEI
ncbi:hypothetical protein BGX28_008365 [Mortierella sp. GBA30]|nr:hypothetical protein BGX28_008365 [Mortierella sp. GBA30]